MMSVVLIALVVILSLVEAFEVQGRPELQFSGSEHVQIGNDHEYLQMLLRPNGEDFISNFDDDDVRVNFSASVFPFTTPNGLNLRTYGNLVGSFGDFFGPVREEDIICRQTTTQSQDDVIWKVFGQLWNNSASTADYYNRIQQLLDDEIAAVRALLPSHQPYEIYANLGDTRFFLDFVGSYLSQYLIAALWNFDHFADSCAQNAYHFIHRRAMALARESGLSISSISNFSSAPLETRQNALRAARNGLEKAYVLNAYADHVLSDTFSAGHLRTPRTALQAICIQPFDSGYAAKLMHDEDNRNGLWVRNNRGNIWKTFGDGMYFDNANAPARLLEREALQISKNEIYDAFNGSPDSFGAAELIPNLNFASDFDYLNICPLYQSISGKIYRRATNVNRPNVWLVANGFASQVAGSNLSATTCDHSVYEEYTPSLCPISFLSFLPGLKMLVEAPIIHSFNESDFNPVTWTWTATKDGDYGSLTDSSFTTGLKIVLGVVIIFIFIMVVIAICCCRKCGRQHCYGVGSHGPAEHKGDNEQYKETKSSPTSPEKSPTSPEKSPA